jgi:hypothetical protein
MRDPAAMSDSSLRIAEARHTRALRGFIPIPESKAASPLTRGCA